MSRPIALACVTALAAIACRQAPTATTMTSDVRVLDVLRAPRGGRIVHGADVTLDRDTRRTLAMPASTVALGTLDADAAPPRYRLTDVPELARAWGRGQAIRTADVGGKQVPLAPAPIDLTVAEPVVPVVPRETPAPQIALFLSADVTGRLPTVETEPFVVPAGAVLTFAVGVHASAARLPVHVGARVTVVDGAARRVVWRSAVGGDQERWRPERVSLARFAGRTVRLRFTTRPGAAAALGMRAVFAEPVVLARRERPAHPLNVVLISMDALRARSVGTYGCARPTTPTLDALGADGVVFEDAFSTAAFTLPGHMSMLTGLWFRTHRALTAEANLSPERRTLAEVLQAAGYATGAFTSGAWIMPWTGFRRGFDVYYEQPGVLPGREPAGGRPSLAFTRSLEWIDRNRDRPFFAFLHNYVVHGPYTSPAPYNRLFDALPPDAGETEQFRLGYEQKIRYGDDQIRAFFEALRATGLADRTLVVITSDHGEQLREHGGLEHTYFVYDEVARVPLVMRLPGAIHAGTRIAEPVSLVDVVPTVVELLGLPPVHGVEGTSLVPLLAGTSARLPRDGVFTEAASEPGLGWTDLAAVNTRTHACIHFARTGRHECWDRRVDPWQEGAPLPDEATDDGARAAREVLARFTASAPPPGAPLPAAAPAPAGQVDDERKEQLRQLGYVE